MGESAPGMSGPYPYPASMPRPARDLPECCIFHVTARGNDRRRIFADACDRRRFLRLIGQAMHRFDVKALAYCLMDNHYHFIVHAQLEDLSKAMRYVNAGYALGFNRRHGASGHLFQGRFHAVLIDADEYLFRASTYAELNPVRAGLVAHPADWAWSSYRVHVGSEPAPIWLDVDMLHRHLLGHDICGVADRRRAEEWYAGLIDLEGHRMPLPGR